MQEERVCGSWVAIASRWSFQSVDIGTIYLFGRKADSDPTQHRAAIFQLEQMRTLYMSVFHGENGALGKIRTPDP